MAGAHSAGGGATSFPLTPTAPTAGKSPVSVSSLPFPFPPKRTRRRNHLRQKILKTLENKPYPNPFPLESPSQNPTIPAEETPLQQSPEADLFSLSESTSFVDGVFGELSKASFAKIALYLVGAFVFQTIFTVWMLTSNDLPDGEDEKLDSDDYNRARVLDLGVNGNNESKPESNYPSIVKATEAGVVLVDESEMDKKIVEIQEMARAARQREKLEADKKGLGEDGNDDGGYSSVDEPAIQKEVDGRLTKLRKSLESSRIKLPYSFLRKDGEIEDGNPAVKEAFGPLMFKKKYKYKSPSVDSRDKPKGFDGKEDDYAANATSINGNGVLQNDNGASGNGISSDNGFDILDKREQIDVLNGDGLEISATSNSNDDKESKPVGSEPRDEFMNKSENAKPRGGISKEPKYDHHAVRAARSGKSSNLDARKPRGFGKESQGDTTTSTKHDASNRNGSVRGKKRGKTKPASKFGDYKFSNQTDFWWSRLPYVLAVLMRRGGDGEVSEGLFTLRSTLHVKDGLSHTVAFEDRADAANFCYLLESFFDDLGDFSTEIIPIPVNELEEAVKSEVMKVVVVKKGQVKLYAGQPLTDVETALRSLIDERNT